MIFHIVTWIAFSCSGWFADKLIPESLKPMICEPTPRKDFFDKEDDAREAIHRLGPTARPVLEVCNGFRCKQKKLIWGSTLEVK